MVNSMPVMIDPIVIVVDQFWQTHNYELLFDNIQTVEINFLNKENNDTKIDHSGAISEDLLIIVNKICVDHIDLTNKLHKISVFKDHNGQIHRSFNYITFNGNFKIKIHKNLLYTDWLASHV